ncbi:MAG: helix-turn-helix transcriptional regulator, partial [Ruminiclostridium sp.]
SKAKEESSLSEQKDFEALIPKLQEQFWISLLVGAIKGEESIMKKSKLLRLNLDMNSPCAVLDIQFSKDEDNNLSYYEQQENRHNLINNIFEGETEGIKLYPTHFSSNILKVVAITNLRYERSIFKEKLEVQIEERRQSVLKLLKLKFEIKIEKIFKNIIELAEYKSTLQMHVQEQETREVRLVPADFERLMQKYKLLIAIINDGDFEELDSLMDNIFFEFRNIPIEQVKQLLIDMFSMISSKFMKMGSDLWIHLNERVNYQEFLDVNTLKELKVKSKDRLRDAINIVNSKQNDASKSVVEQAISYMKENYVNELSLESVADRYFLNPAYFSRLFKQYTGTTFTDYLIELRMEKAAELILLGKYKVYEVSQKVGYKSEKYFFRVFKQYTGSSPSEYYKNKVLMYEK